MNKHPAIKITISRGEGPSALCGKPQTFEGEDCWEQARAHLTSQGHSFPAKGGYDKHDFEVFFADGDSWEGRLDCKHPLCSDPDIDVAKHILDFANFYAGHRCPVHMTTQRYDLFLAQDSQMKDRMVEFLDTYAIPA